MLMNITTLTSLVVKSINRIENLTSRSTGRLAPSPKEVTYSLTSEQ